MGLPIISLPKEIFVVHVRDFPRVPKIRLGAQSDRICGHFLQSSSRLVFEQTLEHSALNCLCLNCQIINCLPLLTCSWSPSLQYNSTACLLRAEGLRLATALNRVFKLWNLGCQYPNEDVNRFVGKAYRRLFYLISHCIG